MAGIAMLVLALIAAVAILFVLRTDDGAEYDETTAHDRELTRR